MLAIVALLAGMLLGAWWMDPLMGLIGAALVTRWSWGLVRDSSRILLDHQAPAAIREAVHAAIEGVADNRLYDLHVWSVAPGAYAATLGVVTHTPGPPGHYEALIPGRARPSSTPRSRCRSAPRRPRCTTRRPEDGRRVGRMVARREDDAALRHINAERASTDEKGSASRHRRTPWTTMPTPRCGGAAEALR